MVDRQTDMNDSVETNFDTQVSDSRLHDTENPALVYQLLLEVARLRQEVALVKFELE